MKEMVVGSEVGRTATPPPPPPQALLERLKDYGQEDAFALWDQISPEERDLLVKDIESLDLPRVDRIIRCSLGSQGHPLPAGEPVPESSVSTVEERTPEERERWWKRGLKAISEGKLAVVLLSGGQGTRLGSSDPKGCFNIGLPSGKSLFQLQAERILSVQRLAAQSTDARSAGIVPIHWYIMTSPFTDEATRKFFVSHKYFGLEADQVTFFRQGTLPCVSRDGRFIMETPCKVAKAPDGNGGLYAALKSSRLLEDMAMRGIKYVDVYGVDNALVRVADPAFLGYFIDKGVTAAAKVVRKVCLHMFTLDFLNQVANGLEKDCIYHLAEKKIPSIHGHTMGLKLEQFIFDAFAYAPSTALFEVLREDEFAPVKNANGASHDTPDSARLMLLRLHSRWVVAAGGFLTHSVPLYLTGVEISPLCSYAGENLEAMCRGRTFHAPCEIAF
ncbi:UDP-N-acetylglucosamine diphosphorylase 2 isoform X2 [Phoenix dactylifera]|uniref:UDP-N-acetylglucosamine diphosphorylase n=1 Tax=Phoenix dactylifera TaxID=42345 RepID=A0A8B8JC88_PHODC|nr:UDP-N-acetylglucosamine diphosphorylase 2 isoform X2 [Phoenix dactylifera]